MPQNDGGCPITGYKVEKCDFKRKSYVKAGTTDANTLTLKVTGLVEGNKYLFKVYAENEIGLSEPVESQEPVTAKLPFDPPGPPVDLKAEDVTKDTATITWGPPEFNGGSPVTGYYVEKKSGKRWTKVNKKATAELSLTMKDLIQKDKYEIQVFAENAAGVGKPCKSIDFIAKDQFDVPGQPGKPTVDEIRADSADLSWTAPTTDGGAPITNYVVEMRKPGDRKWTLMNKGTPVSETSFTVTDLKEETEYEFRVTAENKAGQGPPSLPSDTNKYSKYGWLFCSAKPKCIICLF